MIYGTEATSMQGEIMLACVGQNGNRAAGVADRTKEMEVFPFHGQM
jgi:hypothetical protein